MVAINHLLSQKIKLYNHGVAHTKSILSHRSYYDHDSCVASSPSFHTKVKKHAINRMFLLLKSILFNL